MYDKLRSFLPFIHPPPPPPPFIRTNYNINNDDNNFGRII